MIRRLVILMFTTLLLTACNEASESKSSGSLESNGSFIPGGTPIVWIFFDNEKYIGSEVYQEKPEGLISTQLFTKEGDYAPDKEIFRNSDSSTFFIQEGHEWTAFKKEK